MRRFLGAWLTILLFSCPVEAAERIRIAIPGPAAQFIPLPLAQAKGFLKDEGLEAEIIVMRGNVAMAALAKGDIDYYANISSGVQAAMQGLPVKVVTCYVPSPPIALIARPEFKSVKELKRQTAGISAFGDTPHIVGRAILKHFGLDPERDVKFLVTGDGPARLAATKHGLTAATLISAPGDHQGVKMGLVVLARAPGLISYPGSGLVTTTRKIRESRDEIKRVIKAGITASRYIRAEREGTILFLMERGEMDRELATATYESVSRTFNEDGSLPEEGLRLAIDEAKKFANAAREVSPADVADLSILKEAQKELGTKQRGR